MYIGACWCLNYVCILVAGAYLPNPVQAIFSQASTVATYVISTRVYKHELRPYHHMIIGVIVTVNLSTAWGGNFEALPGAPTGALLFLWCIVFVVNSLAGGAANNLLEAFFMAVKLNGDKCATFTKWDYILAINAMAGVWSVIVSLPLIVLAWAAYGDDTVTRVFSDWSSFASADGQKYVFLMGIR